MFNYLMYIEGLHTHLHEKRAFLCTECTDLVLSFVYGNVRINRYHYGICTESTLKPCGRPAYVHFSCVPDAQVPRPSSQHRLFLPVGHPIGAKTGLLLS